VRANILRWIKTPDEVGLRRFWHGLGIFDNFAALLPGAASRPIERCGETYGSFDCEIGNEEALAERAGSFQAASKRGEPLGAVASN
jgi:hypothetical protein